MTRSEIQQVVETNDGLYLLFIDYEEGDIASAIGHVYRTSGDRDEVPPTQMLATSDTLRAMWASPNGSLWVGSADGNVGTTAKVNWQRPPNGADYKTLGDSAPWTATELPALRSNGLPPNIGILWGTDNDDVYASAYGGHIYHWDGGAWAQVYESPPDGMAGIGAFGGTGAKDVFAVGSERMLLHFDGTRWRPLELPPPVRPHEVLTGVHSLASGEIFISSSISGEEGRLLHGSADGFTEFARSNMQLIAMAPLGERLLFATGDGVAELIGREIRMIKSTFATSGLFPGNGRVFFLEPAPDRPSYVEYDPRQETPWWGMEF